MAKRGRPANPTTFEEAIERDADLKRWEQEERQADKQKVEAMNSCFAVMHDLRILFLNEQLIREALINQDQEDSRSENLECLDHFNDTSILRTAASIAPHWEQAEQHGQRAKSARKLIVQRRTALWDQFKGKS